MSFFKDKYNTVSEFFKDIRRAIDSLTTRVDDLDTRRDDSIIIQPRAEDSDEQESVELSVSVDELGVASLMLDNNTDPVKVVGGNGVTLSVNEDGALQIDASGGGVGGSSAGLYSRISGNSAIVSVVGSTGSVVRINGGDNVNITGSNGIITISADTGGGGSGGGSSGGSSGGESESVNRHVLSAKGVYQMVENGDYIVYYPYPYDSHGYTTEQYDFETTTGRTAAIAAIQNVTGKSVVDTDNGFTDDAGNMILILPLNPTHLSSVRVFCSPGSTRVVVVSVEGKRIISNNGRTQGINNGVYTDYVEESNFLYVYVSSTSGWPSRYGAGYNFENVITQCARTSPGCWVRIQII